MFLPLLPLEGNHSMHSERELPDRPSMFNSTLAEDMEVSHPPLRKDPLLILYVAAARECTICAPVETGWLLKASYEHHELSSTLRVKVLSFDHTKGNYSCKQTTYHLSMLDRVTECL